MFPNPQTITAFEFVVFLLIPSALAVWELIATRKRGE